MSQYKICIVIVDWACWRAGRGWARGWVRRQGRWACWRWAWVQAWRAGVGRLGGRACWACRARARQEGVRGARGRGTQGAQAWHVGRAGERQGMGVRSAGGRGARGRASGRAGVGGSDARARAKRSWVSGTVAATRPCWSATQAGPGCDTVRPRATIRPLCAPGCAQLGQIWVLCTLTRFLARFDLLSHQMNTVHCEINFSKKKYIF